MNINIVCVGKIKEKYIEDGIKEFCKRMGPYAKIKFYELREYTNEKSIAKSVEKETEEIEKTLAKLGGYNIMLDLNGKDMSSEEMASHISKLANNSIHDINFIIGGSNGYGAELLSLAHLKLRFSKFTFPHQLIRLILMEQIYRWFSIINNIKYHK